MSAIIEIQGLTKKYGSLTALDDLNLTIEEGAVFGFIGPNGAGKTTTMRILTTLLKPSSGRAWVAGHDVPLTNAMCVALSATCQTSSACMKI
jgi:ABC-2 type transport system ATP-binding protein